METASTQLATINTGPEIPKTESLPTTIITAVTVVVVLAVAAGLLVYFKNANVRLDELVKTFS